MQPLISQSEGVGGYGSVRAFSSRPQSAPNSRALSSRTSSYSASQGHMSPSQGRPLSAKSTTSVRDMIMGKTPTGLTGVRARNPSVRMPHVNLYQNGKRIDGSGKNYALAPTMPQIYCDATSILSLPFSAKVLYNAQGEKLDTIAAFMDKMDVVVSMGERFKFKTYLTKDERDVLPRICKYCHSGYSPAENAKKSCKRHALSYVNHRWMCCNSSSREAEGCSLGYHADTNYDDDLNVIPERRVVTAVLNGMPLSAPGFAIIDIPSKFDILLENCSRKLKLTRYATNLHSERGVPIKCLDEIEPGMTVIVSFGENFRWDVYLTKEELQTISRKCRRCLASFTAATNHPTACNYHHLGFSSAIGYWICCRQRNTEKKAPGCKAGYHWDPKFDISKRPSSAK